MNQSTVYFVGTESEVAHHAAPLSGKLDYRVREPFDVLYEASPGDVAVFFSEHFDRFRDTCVQLKARNVATLYMLDGILEWRNAWEDDPDGPACPFTMRPVLSHKVACIGASQQRILNSWGNELKAEVVGVPRFDSLPRPNQTLQPRPEDGAFRILVATAKTPGFTSEQTNVVERSLLDIRDYFSEHSKVEGRKIEIVWRLTEGLAAILGVENSLNDLSGGEIAAQLKTVDAVISSASTLILEAMLFDRPVALLDYHNSPAYVKTSWAIRCQEHIESTIPELIKSFQTKMLFQRSELNDAVYCGTDATERMVRLIREMQSAASCCLRAGEELSFPSQMLTPIGDVSSNSVGYDSESVFSDFAEFQESDRVELQAQLAHSRREIKHLQTRLTVREAELAQAHEIFDKLNTHPIIGPFVKLGRWWRRLLGNEK